MEVSYEQGGAIVSTPKVSFTYQVAETPRDFDRRSSSGLDALRWNNIQNHIGEYIIYPYGTNNDLPQIIADIVHNSYNVPGFLKRKTELLWGAGPKLYVDKLIDGKDTRVRVDNIKIQKWLDSIDYEKKLLQACVDYQHIQGTFTRYELNKGSRIGKPFIANLHHVHPDKGRLARLRSNKNLDPTHIVISNWNFNHINAVADSKAYPLFDFNKPFANENSILYSNMYSFCSDYYTVPDLYGSLEWINRSTAVPLIFKAFAKNSMNLKYHIISPAGYWEKKKSELQAYHKADYNDKMLQELERKILDQFADVLSGADNVGKYLHTTEILKMVGHDLVKEGWEIKVLDQKIKDFVEAQILISDKADKAISAGVNIHPVLANITDSGRANSGSEQIYALLNYLNTGVDIQEMIICKPWNYALKANFPEDNVKIGFFHNVPEVQQNTNPDNRTKNSQ